MEVTNQVPNFTLWSSLSGPLTPLSTPELIALSSHITHELTRRGRPHHPSQGVPLDIFSGELSPAEALVKHLKEASGLRLSEIAKIILRDERGLWSTYRRATKKSSNSPAFDPAKPLIPLEAFSDRRLSLFEGAIFYLIDQRQFSCLELSHLLNKSYSTIYTTYRRAATKKRGGLHE